MIIDVEIPRGLAVSDENQHSLVVGLGIHGVRLEVRAVEWHWVGLDPPSCQNAVGLSGNWLLTTLNRRLQGPMIPRSPDTRGRPGTARGRGSAPTPCRKARPPAYPRPWPR